MSDVLSARALITAALSAGAPIIVLDTALQAALCRECGGPAAMADWLIDTATWYGRPIGIDVRGCTRYVAPVGWTAERLRRYLYDQAFGELEAATPA